jgi:hypothetical protein
LGFEQHSYWPISKEVGMLNAYQSGDINISFMKVEVVGGTKLTEHVQSDGRCEVCGEPPERKSLWCRLCNERYTFHLRQLVAGEAELAVWRERGRDYGQPMTGDEQAAILKDTNDEL